jgi:hypothetical protein
MAAKGQWRLIRKLKLGFYQEKKYTLSTQEKVEKTSDCPE